MSQPSVTAYFNTRKRQTCDNYGGKFKVLLLERDHSSSQALIDTENFEQAELNDENIETSSKTVLKDAPVHSKKSIRANKAVRNIQFDSSKASRSRMRASCSRTLSSTNEGQKDIRSSLIKIGTNNSEIGEVSFEKNDMPSSKKEPQTPKKNVTVPKDGMIKEVEIEPSINGLDTPTSSKKILSMERSTKKFEKIEFEISVSPQKRYKSPIKALQTSTKNRDLLKAVDLLKPTLFEPKETTHSVKCSSLNAYQKYQSLVESKIPGLVLPGSYRFLAEVFRCVDTVSAMLFNRKELITFNKLKSAVQKLLRRNITLEHLAQIKTIYPDAYTYHQEKYHNFDLVSKQKRYELVLTPVVEANNGRNTLDADNVLKSASESSMSPTILLERRKKFYNILLERVKDEHDKFLQSFGSSRLMNIPMEKMLHWHCEFNVESCKEIEQAELPQPPHINKITAKDFLDKNYGIDKVKSLFGGTRIEKALQRLIEVNVIPKYKSISSTQDSISQTIEDDISKVNIPTLVTPPITPSTQISHDCSRFKNISKTLLEKVRAKQAAKALEAMTRTRKSADKEIALYSRLPELAKSLRNIFVTEKKGVLSMKIVLQLLDNSFRTKLTFQEMEEYIQRLCKLLPTWACIHKTRYSEGDYLSLDRNIELTKVIEQLEVLVNTEIKTLS